MTHDIPPPFPPAGEDATHFVPSMGAPPPIPSGRAPPPPLPQHPPQRRQRHAAPPPRPHLPEQHQENPHTNTRFAVPIQGEAQTDMGPAGRERRHAADARIRQPAPVASRPALLPNAEAARQVRGPQTIRPNVINPVRPKNDTGRGFGDNSRESSDVISSFEQAMGHNQAAPRPMVADGRMRPRRSNRKPSAAQPARPLASRAAGSRQAPPRQTYNPRPRPAPPPMLPLNQEHLGLLIADQRRRLHVLYGYARGLEIAAGILGTLSLAVLIASMVSMLVGSGATVVTSASALAGGATGLSLTLIMVVGAVAIRQLAHASAQIAALIESLCQPPQQ